MIAPALRADARRPGGPGAAPDHDTGHDHDARHEVAASRALMGGRVSVVLRGDAAGVDGRGEAGTHRPTAEAVLDRIAAWAARLTRFDPASELRRLNDSTGPVHVGPTLTAVLDWSRMAEDLTDGLVDVSMLDARLAAEVGGPYPRPASLDAPRSSTDRARIEPATRRWSLLRDARGAVVRREPGVRFDLDGVAKGWLADRALALMRTASALVDADGDVAVRLAPGDSWDLGVADPRTADGMLAVVRIPRGETGRTLGVATSGTSVHRWATPGGSTHHLIDPRTRRPAETDVVQATVIASSARVAEAHAKTAVVAGAADAFRRLRRPDVLGLLLLTERGDILATPEMTAWLA